MQVNDVQIAIQGQENQENIPFRIGTVRRNISGQGVQIDWNGAQEDNKYYMRLGNYEPKVGDRVIAVKYKGTYCILGNLVR